MKHIYLSLSLALSGLAAFAQPQVAASLPAANTQFAMYTSSTQVAHSGPGASQSWNYASANKTILLTQKWVDITSVSQQIRDSFPAATHAIEQYLGSAVVSTEMYMLTSDRWMYLGSKGSGSSWNHTGSPAIRFRFPMNMGDTALAMDGGSLIMYDAYGTLTTPFGTYNNVIRLRRTDTGNPDTLFYFYQFSPSYKLLAHYVVDAANGSRKNIFFYEPMGSGTSVKEAHAALLSCYPNPLMPGHALNLGKEMPAGTRIIISDASGRMIRSMVLNDAQQELVMDLQPGVYFLSVTNTQESGYSKVIVQ